VAQYLVSEFFASRLFKQLPNMTLPLPSFFFAGVASAKICALTPCLKKEVLESLAVAVPFA
jgi:hypothetical protein